MMLYLLVFSLIFCVIAQHKTVEQSATDNIKLNTEAIAKIRKFFAVLAGFLFGGGLVEFLRTRVWQRKASDLLSKVEAQEQAASKKVGFPIRYLIAGGFVCLAIYFGLQPVWGLVQLVSGLVAILAVAYALFLKKKSSIFGFLL